MGTEVKGGRRPRRRARAPRPGGEGAQLRLLVNCLDSLRWGRHAYGPLQFRLPSSLVILIEGLKVNAMPRRNGEGFRRVPPRAASEEFR